jgi:membrane complex biogenesis BtpA family protein
MSRLRTIFAGIDRPLIAMAHVPALPGTPLYDPDGGIPRMVEAVAADVAVIVEAGFDGVLFCNENDRPYQLSAGLEAAAVMSRIVTECRPSRIPFGVDYLWDARCALAVAVGTEANFMREVCTGVWESDMGLLQPDAAETLRERSRLRRDDLAVLMNVTPEFASPIGSRSAADTARSVAVSSVPDAILVSGAMAGMEPDASTLAAVRNAVPAEIPVLLNTGARAETIAEHLRIADGCIVGSDLKVNGHTWNPIDGGRARRFVEAARSI